MSDQVEPEERASFKRSGRTRAVVVLTAIAVLAGGLWYWATRGREITDDAQVDAHVTPIAARVGGTVLRVNVTDNQLVEPGTLLVEIDRHDYQIAVDRARAELADAEAGAIAAQSNVPITSATATTAVSMAQGSVDQARSAVDAAARDIEMARARLVVAQAHLRQAEANAVRSARDVERLRGLLAKDEVSQQQFDAAEARATADQAATDAARAQVAEAEAGIRVAESRRAEAQAGEAHARAALQGVQTAPEQVTAVRARAAAAQARVEQAKATLAQAERNLEYTMVNAPARGVVSKKSITPGQVIQANQPLLALVQTGDIWITANFKETQLEHIRPGQRATMSVDGFGGKRIDGHVLSISAATGARFSLLPPENATGNFVKVVQRVPVKIAIEAGQDPEGRLRPGMSVTATVFIQ